METFGFKDPGGFARSLSNPMIMRLMFCLTVRPPFNISALNQVVILPTHSKLLSEQYEFILF